MEALKKKIEEARQLQEAAAMTEMLRNKRKHNHAEAFMLMEYACEDCGFSEAFWNSRDGVTPFGTNCQECGGPNMLHHNWSKDQYAPAHIPHPGQGVWIDIPESLRSPATRARIASFNGTEFELKMGSERYVSVFTGVRDSDFRPDSPWLIRWPG